MNRISKFFTTGRIFVFMFALIMACFLYAGYESTLTGLGFETKTSLRNNLATQTQAVNQAAQTNKDNVAEINQLKARQETLLKELEILTDRKQQLEKDADKIKDGMEKKSQKATAGIEKKKVVTDTTITLPIAEVDALSAVNIDGLHEAFEQFILKG